MKKLALYNIIFLLASYFIQPAAQAQSSSTPVKIAVAGISHGHSGWILGKKDSSDVVVKGIFESDRQLAEAKAKEFKLSSSLFYHNLDEMLDAVKPEAVVAFGSIFDHLKVVEACAPRGIHVMVEKPLAVSLQHAIRVDSLARKHKIHLLTNYETSWYPSTVKAAQLMNDSNYAGRIRKAVFHHGHEGPKEIGVGSEFLEWLTDPILNGGGALIDFGCYGANIMTHLMGSERPLSVFAVTQHFKPAVYPKVDDEATIVVEYPGAQCIIQASWNWPFGRKDMELYGDQGYVITYDHERMKMRNRKEKEKLEKALVKETGVYTDPFKYFAAVIRKKIIVPEYGLYSLSNNLLVVEILEAARESARTGKKIIL